MGAENQKESRPAEPSLALDTAQEVYKLTTEKLFHSLQPTGKRPHGAITQKQRKSSLPQFTPIAEGQQQRKDTRSFTKMSMPLDNPDKVSYPECCVGYMQANESGVTTITGSAFLIHKRLALTCAHNCMSFDNRKEYSNLYFCLNQQGETLKVKVKKVHYLDGLFQGEMLIKSQNYLDFAVIELQKNLEEDHGYLGISFQCATLNPSTVVTVMGYTGREKPQFISQSAKISSMGPKIMTVAVPPNEQLYGGPLLTEINGQYFAFGISLWSDVTAPEASTKAFKLYRYLFQTLNTNFSNTVGHLNLRYRWVNDEKMQKLTRQKYQLVTDLVLQGNTIGPEGVSHIINAGWSELKSIILTNNNIEDRGLEILCTGNWSKLNKLKIGNNAITSAGMEHLSKCNWSILTSLSIEQNKIRNKGLQAIINAPFKNLTELNLYQTWINADGIKIIVEAGYNNLQVLDIGANRIREEGIKELSRGQWHYLQILGLNQAAITDKAVEHLKEADWPNLKVLDLSKNHLTQLGLQALFHCNFKKMKDLNLRDNKISLKGVNSLAGSGWLSLQQVDMRWNNLAEGDKQSLKDVLGKSFPKMRKIYM